MNRPLFLTLTTAAVMMVASTSASAATKEAVCIAPGQSGKLITIQAPTTSAMLTSAKVATVGGCSDSTITPVAITGATAGAMTLNIQGTGLLQAEKVILDRDGVKTTYAKPFAAQLAGELTINDSMSDDTEPVTAITVLDAAGMGPTISGVSLSMDDLATSSFAYHRAVKSDTPMGMYKLTAPGLSQAAEPVNMASPLGTLQLDGYAAATTQTITGPFGSPGLNLNDSYLRLPMNGKTYPSYSIEMLYNTGGSSVLYQACSEALFQIAYPQVLMHSFGGSDCMSMPSGQYQDQWVGQGGWKHIVVSVDNGHYHLYMNGQSMITEYSWMTLTPPLELDRAPITFGARNYNGTFTNFWVPTLVDEIGLYDRALSQAEAADHYAALSE